MEQELDFTNDLLFRYVFGAEKNKDILLSLLNAILTRKELAPIQSLQILNPFLEINQIGEKKSIADILAEDEAGKIYNIEMQRRKTTGYIDRTLIYTAKILAGQIKKRENYNEARPCVGIHILDFTLLDTFPHFHNAFGIFSFDEPHTLLSDKFSLHYIEIPKVDFSSSHFTLLEKMV